MAIGTALVVVAVTAYDYTFNDDVPGELNYRRGNLRLEDAEYAKALLEFNLVLERTPLHSAAYLGRGLALMGLGDNAKALESISRAIDLNPEFGAAHADRGILLDKMGEPEKALLDYRKALQLDAELGEGPDWFTRFFRLQPERPPTIADRAAYLEREMKKPPSQRILKVPEVDDAQRSYKVEGKP
jgi:tetratricopeptide (TPR) repeat protein